MWQIAIALAVIFAAARVVGVLGPKELRWLLPLGFTLMALTPFALLDAAGRRDAGLKWSRQRALVWRGDPRRRRHGRRRVSRSATRSSASAPTTGSSPSPTTIARSMDTTGWPTARLHLVFTLPALIFSPIGEEIFFRGYLQYSLEQRFSTRASTIAECAAFGIVHLCHHGLFLSASRNRLAAGVGRDLGAADVWSGMVVCLSTQIDAARCCPPSWPTPLSIW